MPLTGEIRAFAFDATNLEKVGWVECDGREVDKHKYPELEKRLGAAAKFPWGSPGPSIGSYYLPDLRGMFLRGWQNKRSDGGGDPEPNRQPRTGDKGNKVGTLQASENKEHFHNRVFNPGDNMAARFAMMGGLGGGHQHIVMDVSSPELVTSNAGGRESRPVNAYVCYCIYVLKDSNT